MKYLAGLKQVFQVALLLGLWCGISLGISPQPAQAVATKRVSSLPPGNAITDGKTLLRYSLPIDNKPVRDLQKTIEDIGEQLRAQRRWGGVMSDIDKASKLIVDRKADLLAGVVAGHESEVEGLLGRLNEQLATIKGLAEQKDRDATLAARFTALDTVGAIEDTMVAQFPFEVPTEYAKLPQLKGRATVEFKTKEGTIQAVVDGYSAPVTAGNFVDLVQRKFYDGLEFNRAEDFYVLQTGDPKGPAEGFIDPKTKQERKVPLEYLVQGDTVPTYGLTLEEAGRYKDQPVLPFSAYGALAMARPGEENNGGSSQFFFFLFEPELTPAGLNLLDGRYSVFGYVTQNKEILGKLKAGDVIESVRVIKGAENLAKG